MKKILLSIFASLFFVSVFAQGVIISEIADGTGAGGYPKYVELTNTGTTNAVLDGYVINKYINGAPDATAAYTFASYTLGAGESVVITNMDNTTAGQLWSDFGLTTPTNVIHGETAVNGNGDDQYELVDGSGTRVDVYGEDLTDGTGTAWDYLDSYAYRNYNITSPNGTFTASEWTIAGIDVLDDVTDMSAYLTPGTHTYGSGPNIAAEISGFELAEQAAPAVINSANATVDVSVMPGTDVTNLIPTVTVSTGATVVPASGVAQDFTTPVTYTVTAEDGSTEKAWTVTVSSVSMVDIYDIQYTADASGDSPYITQTVLTGGIVTATKTGAYWVQSGTGPWSGAYVYDAANTPNIGDSITFTCEVTEYYDLTELTNVSGYTVVSTGNTVPATVIGTGDASAEMYESVLVKFETAECVDANVGYGMWNINNGATLADTVYVDDDLYAYTPTQGTNYDVTGVMYYSYSEWKALPRNANDVIESGSAGSQAEIVTFTFAEQTGPATITSAGGTVAIEVANGTDVTNLTPTITVSTGATIDPASGVAQDFSSAFTYTVTAQDATTKVWTVTVTEASASGYTSIYDIQYTADASGDSPYATQTVETGGIVTGVKSGAYWMQSGTGPWTGIYVFDMNNTPSVGDSVTFSAEVSEYYNLTELSYVTNYNVVSSGNVVPETVIGTGDGGQEMYESVLVKFESAECVNANAGYGMWTINNGTPTTDDLYVDDDLYAYTPTQGTSYDVTGIMYYNFSEWKVIPRDVNDVTVLGINEINGTSGISMYPNPTDSYIVLENMNEGSVITITDVTGKTVISEESSSVISKIDVSSLESGVYFISVVSSEGNASGSLIKK